MSNKSGQREGVTMLLGVLGRSVRGGSSVVPLRCFLWDETRVWHAATCTRLDGVTASREENSGSFIEVQVKCRCRRLEARLADHDTTAAHLGGRAGGRAGSTDRGRARAGR